MANVEMRQCENGVTWIQINREEIRNAVNEQVMKELNKALDMAELDESKVIVLSGAGKRAFCSGGDLTAFQHLMTEEDAKKMFSKMGSILERIAFFPKITVAALNGTAVGGGSELASACDLRIAAPHSKVGFVQANLGITTGWGGATLLFERIPKPEALHMLVTAKMFPVTDLVNNGFIKEIIHKEPFEEGVIDYVTPFLSHSAEVLKAYKLRLIEHMNRSVIHQHISNEISHCAKLWETKEHHEAVRTFLHSSKES
ncbi:enoyl-CoA hydratase/isomerase family protein [Alkalihalobacillus sp. MEB130]|uniref:enoyl-CoA hydratase/isomerase family protein n=1 Tax=Alkalihalobacillus sp. MEB130 TaxID=2976704 RepID=UPI0028DD8CCC|nr:enoyl-CoA hydratase/isomerase family protein [Alkalihalobacillus sp. MEB130]MDT8859135.1 enoyl-CoA hydratase/isomerase family protein [Alkalihalobacillus sp. MEB130]